MGLHPLFAGILNQHLGVNEGGRELDTQEIPFTQYLRPNGRIREISIARPVDIHEKAMRIIDAGYQFEVEELTTGHVSMTISKDDEDHDIELVNNGPEVPLAVDRMVDRFYGEMARGEAT